MRKFHFIARYFKHFLSLTVFFFCFFFVAATTLSTPAFAAGTVKLRSSEIQESSGVWHIYITIELPKVPPYAHLPLRFVFQKTAVYERSLVDGKTEPVLSRIVLQNQVPSTENMDVDFSDATGKIYKVTKFDFVVTRERGYESGEYKFTVRTSEANEIGQTQAIKLLGDNPAIDRRAIELAPKKTEPKTQAASPPAAYDNGEVKPVGSAPPFIPHSAYQPTPEEQGKVEQKRGCGCDLSARDPQSSVSYMVLFILLGGIFLRFRIKKREPFFSL